MKWRCRAGMTTRFEVYEPTTLALAAGDRIRVTHNGQSADGHRLDNGALYTVDGFTRQGDLRLANGWIIGQDYGHLATGFYTTSHASQGKTVDQVLIAQSTLSAPASSREQFYVSVSRGREGVRIYTDDKEALRGQILRSGQRGSATELLEQRLAADTEAARVVGATEGGTGTPAPQTRGPAAAAGECGPAARSAGRGGAARPAELAGKDRPCRRDRAGRTGIRTLRTATMGGPGAPPGSRR